MKELDHHGHSFAQEWVWQRPRSTARIVVLTIASIMFLLFAALIIEELTGFTVLAGRDHSRADTDSQKKIYWHSSTKGSRYE